MYTNMSQTDCWILQLKQLISTVTETQPGNQEEH